MFDVIIIGGSYAGLAAALQLGRARRRVLILDAGQRRNRFVGHAYGFLGQDGQPPGAIAAKGREEVLKYPTVMWKDARANDASRVSDGFLVRTETEAFRSKRLILATGVSDELPSTPGLADLWGKRAFFCPYCDGYEFNLGRLGVLATSPVAAHYAVLISEWAGPSQTILFLNGAQEPSAEELALLDSRGVRIEREHVIRFGDRSDAVDVHLADGRTTPIDGLFLHTHARPNGSFAEQLGCEMDTGPMGQYVKTDATKETTARGVFACGDLATPLPAIAHAVSDGVRAGAFAHQSLVFRA